MKQNKKATFRKRLQKKLIIILAKITIKIVSNLKCLN